MHIKVELVGERALLLRFDTLPQRIHDRLKTSISSLAQNLRVKVMQEQLSGPTGQHTLSVISGRLRRSVKWEMTDNGSRGITGEVSYGADVPYARIHELGGTIHIPEIVPTSAKALHFFWAKQGGREMFLRRVAAHDVVMPARAPMKTAFRNYEPVIKGELLAAVKAALKP